MVGGELYLMISNLNYYLAYFSILALEDSFALGVSFSIINEN